MLTEAVAFSREQTPASDVNFNSPGHRSSQDGSFIQDEADMHLILDFDGSRNTTGNRHVLLAGGEYSNGTTYYQPTSVLTSSWINKKQAKWATDFDANIAELDFDNVATRDILAIGAATAYDSPCSPMESYWKNNKEMKDWNQNRLMAESFNKKSLLQGIIQNYVTL